VTWICSDLVKDKIPSFFNFSISNISKKYSSESGLSNFKYQLLNSGNLRINRERFSGLPLIGMFNISDGLGLVNNVVIRSDWTFSASSASVKLS